MRGCVENPAFKRVTFGDCSMCHCFSESSFLFDLVITDNWANVTHCLNAIVPMKKETATQQSVLCCESLQTCVSARPNKELLITGFEVY